MCGIVGVVGRPPLPLDALVRAQAGLTHRGPDDAGLWTSPSGVAALAHRRLAIIDLSTGGHQPMVSAEGRVALTFNGEIYNYRELKACLRESHQFRTASDSEVLLAAYLRWGVACLARLVGMFAFGIWDDRSRQLFLARDRAGEKPLYLWRRQEGIGFASELRALLDLGAPRRMDAWALQAYAALGYVPPHACLLEECAKVPPGHYALYDEATGRLSTRSYWAPPLPEAGAPPVRNLEEAVEARLGEAVRLQLRADVPTGVMLSGGVDSGLVAALIPAEARNSVRAFTVRLPGSELDESADACATAAHLGLEHAVIDADPGALDPETVLAELDEPLGDSSLIPTLLVAQAIRREAVVALGGDGGDELFGGYAHHHALGRTAALVRRLPPLMRRALHQGVRSAYPLAGPGRGALMRLTDPAPELLRGPALLDPVVRRRLIRRLGPEASPGPEEWLRSLGAEAGDPLDRQTRRDFLSYLPGDVLTKVDRMSMRVSLETRAPFLDHRVVEFAFADVPTVAKARRSRGKVLLRRLAQRLLPPQIAEGHKRGFRIPVGTWLAGPWGPLLRRHLLDRPELFDPARVQALRLRARRNATAAEALFALLALALWADHHQAAWPD
jgi:asparagine synthase (glutamine-hydrolysing)